MGVVYHSHYLVWMEIGRTELCRSLGFRYSEMEAQDGILLVVAEANCRYHAPARYDEEIAVLTSVGAGSSRAVRFDYLIHHADTGRKLSSGYTKHIFCNREMRPTKLPAKYHKLFGNDSSIVTRH